MPLVCGHSEKTHPVWSRTSSPGGICGAVNADEPIQHDRAGHHRLQRRLLCHSQVDLSRAPMFASTQMTSTSIAFSADPASVAIDFVPRPNCNNNQGLQRPIAAPSLPSPSPCSPTTRSSNCDSPPPLRPARPIIAARRSSVVSHPKAHIAGGGVGGECGTGGNAVAIAIGDVAEE